MELKKILSEILFLATRGLECFLSENPRRLEIYRSARTLCALLEAGCSIQSLVFKKTIHYIYSYQQSDGGWTDPEETAWAINCISRLAGKDNPAVFKGIQWLKSNRHSGGGWGRHSRDRARIPITALVLYLLPEAGCDEDYEWIAREWAKDLASPVQLSYKGGFYLLAALKPSIQGDSDLIDRTICHLAQDQNVDGGFGPWRDHPIGSDPWSTGVVLWGLSKWVDQVNPEVIERALYWLQVTQLPSGYWPYHYLDEGTSYAIIGTVSAMRAMVSRS